MVFDTTGTDVTTEFADIIKYVPEANNWHFEIDNSNGDLKVDEAYVVSLVGMYIDMTTGTQVGPYNTQTPIVVMEKLKLLDTSAYGVMVDEYLVMADPYIQKHFFDGFAVFFIIFFVCYPGLMTAGNLFLLILIPAAYWGMAVFNIPITVLLASYWSGLVIGSGNLMAAIEAQPEAEPLE